MKVIELEQAMSERKGRFATFPQSGSVWHPRIGGIYRLLFVYISFVWFVYFVVQQNHSG